MKDNVYLSKQLTVIYNALHDDESRSLFFPRLQYMLTGELKYLFDMIDLAIRFAKDKPIQRRLTFRLKSESVNSISDFLNKDDYNKIDVVLFGIGNTFNYATSLLDRYNLNIKYLCDSDKEKQGSVKNGIKVISPEELYDLSDKTHVIISAFHGGWAIYRAMREAGFPQNRIYMLLSAEKQYFGPDFLKPVLNEIYVDCGACYTDTIDDFIMFSNGEYDSIIAFEADARCYRNIVNDLSERQVRNAKAINKGCWFENDSIGFQSNPNLPGTSKIDTMSSESIEVTTIDNVVDDADVTFIKMDIEGAELEALHGAANTIKRCKPRLAISIYHKPGDIIDIPAYILNLVPEYRLYIRQYSYFLGETVLYAVI